MRTFTRYTAEDEKRDALEMLERKARLAGLDLNAASEQMFRVSPECLSETQRGDLLMLLCRAAREAAAKTHKHFCIECGAPISCDLTGCTETEGYDHCSDESESRPSRWLHNRTAVMQ